MPPGPDQRGQADHGAGGIAAAPGALHAVVQADGGGLAVHQALAVVACQRGDLLHRHAAHLGSPLGRPLQGAFAQRGPAYGVLGQVGVVQPVVGDELVHQGQCQCGIGARAQGDVFVAFFGGFGFARVDAHQPCAVAFGLLHVAPEVQVAADGVAAPDQDELRLGKKLHLHADFAAQRVDQAFAACRRADRAVQQRRTQGVEEAGGDALALHQPHSARVAVRQDGLGVAGGNAA